MGCGSGRTTHSGTDAALPHMDAGPTPPHDSGPASDTGGGAHDTSVPPRDTGGAGHDAGHSLTDGGACSVACTSDSQCTSVCGAVPGGGNRCCDTSTSRCFVSHSVCPAPGTDSGGGMSY